ncbi:hypothetical protein SDC9_118588 [bioreactor metagenome]|uniref:Uncharacterized protein n=1 Tax=bioreactor metagenome TaxID=1076179 RepID=A0A645C1I4_9ZZZZ
MITRIFISGYRCIFLRILVGNSSVEALIDITVRDRIMIIAAVTFNAIAIDSSLAGIIRIILYAAADPANLTEADVKAHIAAKNRVRAAVLNAEVVKHRIVRRNNDILPFRELDTLKHLAGISLVTAKVQIANNLRALVIIAVIHHGVAEGRALIQDAVRLRKESQILGQLLHQIEGLALIYRGNVSIQICRINPVRVGFPFIENDVATVHQLF